MLSLRELEETMDLRDPKVPKEPQGLMVPKELEETQAVRERKEHVGALEPMERKAVRA